MSTFKGTTGTLVEDIKQMVKEKDDTKEEKQSPRLVDSDEAHDSDEPESNSDDEEENPDTNESVYDTIETTEATNTPQNIEDDDNDENSDEEESDDEDEALRDKNVETTDIKTTNDAASEDDEEPGEGEHTQDDDKDEAGDDKDEENAEGDDEKEEEGDDNEDEEEKDEKEEEGDDNEDDEEKEEGDDNEDDEEKEEKEDDNVDGDDEESDEQNDEDKNDNGEDHAVGEGDNERGEVDTPENETAETAVPTDVQNSLSTLQQSVEALRASEKQLNAQTKISSEDMVTLNIRMSDMNQKLEEACTKMNGQYNRQLNSCQLNVTESLLDIVKSVVSKPSEDKKAEAKQAQFVKNTPLIMLSALSTKQLKPSRIMRKIMMSPRVQDLSQRQFACSLLPQQRPMTHQRHMYSSPYTTMYQPTRMPHQPSTCGCAEYCDCNTKSMPFYTQRQPIPMAIPGQYSYPNMPNMSSMAAFPFTYGGKKRSNAQNAAVSKKQRGGGHGVYDAQGVCVNCGGVAAPSSPNNMQYPLPQMPTVCDPSFYPLNVPPPTPMVEQQHGGGHVVWGAQGMYSPMHPNMQGGQKFVLPTYAPTVCKQSVFPINGMQSNSSVKSGGGKMKRKSKLSKKKTLNQHR